MAGKKELSDAAKYMIPLLERKKDNINGKWLTGDKLTYVDFIAYETLENCRLLLPGEQILTPKLKVFMSDFEELPKIRDYLNSKRFKKFPLWSERSSVGLSVETIY